MVLIYFKLLKYFEIFDKPLQSNISRLFMDLIREKDYGKEVNCKDDSLNDLMDSIFWKDVSIFERLLQDEKDKFYIFCKLLNELKISFKLHPDILRVSIYLT